MSEAETPEGLERCEHGGLTSADWSKVECHICIYLGTTARSG